MIVGARAALETLFDSAGFTVSAFVPDRITPPLAIITPSGDWVTGGDTFGLFRIGFEVTLVTQTASNARVTDELDQMVDDAIAAVTRASGFYCGSVGSPSYLDVQNAQFLSAAMTVYQNIKL